MGGEPDSDMIFVDFPAFTKHFNSYNITSKRGVYGMTGFY